MRKKKKRLLERSQKRKTSHAPPLCPERKEKKIFGINEEGGGKGEG